MRVRRALGESRGTTRRVVGVMRLVVVLGLTTTLASAAAGCTFERRVDLASDADEGADSLAAAVEEAIEPRAAPLETVEAFHAAVAAGDVSLALALLDREATIVDELVGEASESITRGELLLELRRLHADGLSFEPFEPPTTIATAESALVIGRYVVSRVGPAGAPADVGRLDETVFLVASPEGWRIRHLHRSLAEAPL